MTVDFEADAARIEALKASIEAMTAELKAITSQYEDVPEDKYPAGDFILSVSRQHRFNEAQAARVLTKAKFLSIQKLKADAGLAKAVLAPADYAKTLKPTAAIVTVKRVTDEEA